MCRRPNNIAERTQRVLADDFAIIHSFEIEAISFLNIYVEVVTPKFDHEFIELTPAVDLSHERGLAQFIRDGLAVVIFKESVADTFEFVGIHAQAFEWLELKFTIEIADGSKCELFFDPGTQADLLEASTFFNTWTEGEPIQREEVLCVQWSPRKDRERPGEPAIDRGTRGERRAGNNEGREFEEVASGNHSN